MPGICTLKRTGERYDRRKHYGDVGLLLGAISVRPRRNCADGAFDMGLRRLVISEDRKMVWSEFWEIYQQHPFMWTCMIAGAVAMGVPWRYLLRHGQ
jgi:hypothetical protein